MAEEIRHARAVSPWFIPNKGGAADDLHGLTDLGGDASIPSEEVYVIGKKDKCATDKDTPEVTVPITQLERGEIQTYLTLANLDAEPAAGITLDDFSPALVDVIYYLKDAFNGNLDSSIWFPKTAIASLSLDIGDAQARLTRSFDLTGDNRRIFTGANKAAIHVKDTAPSGTSGNYVIDLSDPAPVVDPKNAGKFMLRVDRTRSGETTTLTETTDYTYSDGTKDLTIVSANASDVYNIYYSAGSFGTPGDPTTVDSDSTCFVKADQVTVLISDGTNEVTLDRITSLSMSATLNRIDENVIGEEERILREISDTPVDVSFSGRIKDFKGEKAFMNQLTETDMISDLNEFNDNVKVTVKIYDNADKDTFLLGYQVDNLSFSDGSLSVTANEFGTTDITANSTDILITTTEGNL